MGNLYQSPHDLFHYLFYVLFKCSKTEPFYIVYIWIYFVLFCTRHCILLSFGNNINKEQYCDDIEDLFVHRRSISGQIWALWDHILFFLFFNGHKDFYVTAKWSCSICCGHLCAVKSYFIFALWSTKTSTKIFFRDFFHLVLSFLVALWSESTRSSATMPPFTSRSRRSGSCCCLATVSAHKQRSSLWGVQSGWGSAEGKKGATKKVRKKECKWKKKRESGCQNVNVSFFKWKVKERGGGNYEQFERAQTLLAPAQKQMSGKAYLNICWNVFGVNQRLFMSQMVNLC